MLFRVLIVEDEGLGRPADQRHPGPGSRHAVRPRRFAPGRMGLLQSGRCDLVIADESRLAARDRFDLPGRRLASGGGVVIDVNQAPLAASTLRREQVIGTAYRHALVRALGERTGAHRRGRISRRNGDTIRLESPGSDSVRDGSLMCIDAVVHPAARSGHISPTSSARYRHHQPQAGGDGAGRQPHAARGGAAGRAHRQLGVELADNRVTWSDELFNIYGIDRTVSSRATRGSFARAHGRHRAHHGRDRPAVEDVTPFIYDHRIFRPDGNVRMLHTRGEVLPEPQRRGGGWGELLGRDRPLAGDGAAGTGYIDAAGDAGGDRGRHPGRRSPGPGLGAHERFLALLRLPADVGPGADIRGLAELVRVPTGRPDVFIRARGRALRQLRREPRHHPLHGRPGVRASFAPPANGERSVAAASGASATSPARTADGIAEARRAEAEAARQQYETILERSPTGSSRSDRTWRLHVREHARAMLGSKAYDLIGRHVWTEFPEAHRRAVPARV